MANIKGGKVHTSYVISFKYTLHMCSQNVAFNNRSTTMEEEEKKSNIPYFKARQLPTQKVYRTRYGLLVSQTY